jgi:hypothetical protein
MSDDPDDNLPDIFIGNSQTPFAFRRAGTPDQAPDPDDELLTQNAAGRGRHARV